MFGARSHDAARLLVLLAPALATASGCATLLGMESATCSDCAPETQIDMLEPGEETPDDEGSSGGPEPPSAPVEPCEAYCELMVGTCSDASQVPDRPYASREACLSLCSHIPPGSTGDTSGNTLTCRASLLQSSEAQSEPELVCEGAGRGGQAGMRPVCGSNCDAYCSFMESVCPEYVADLAGGCAAACSSLPDLYAFDAMRDRRGNSVQCRLWHVGVAADCGGDPECRNRHCEHAVGINECVLAP
jgi:hypothetical protein